MIMLKCRRLALVHVQKWSCSSAEDELQDCIQTRRDFFTVLTNEVKIPAYITVLCCKLIYSPMSFNHGFELSVCAYLKGSQSDDEKLSKVLIVISKKMTLNSEKWEDGKSLKDHKDSLWL